MSLSRRELLRLGLYTGAGMFTGQHQMSMPKSGAAATQASTLAAASTEKPIVLAPYVDPLPIPPVIRPAKSANPLPIRMRAFQQKAHRDLPPTPLWGYNNSWPGPTIEVRRAQPLSVKWSNELPLRHFLPIDPTIHGAEEARRVAGIAELVVTARPGDVIPPAGDKRPSGAMVLATGKSRDAALKAANDALGLIRIETA